MNEEKEFYINAITRLFDKVPVWALRDAWVFLNKINELNNA